MNKQQLIDEIAHDTSLTKAQVKSVVEDVFDRITGTLAKGGKFQIVGFGTFKVEKRSQRMGINPRTGEKIRIDSKSVPVFSPGKKLIDRVNRKV